MAGSKDLVEALDRRNSEKAGVLHPLTGGRTDGEEAVWSQPYQSQLPVPWVFLIPEKGERRPEADFLF